MSLNGYRGSNAVIGWFHPVSPRIFGALYKLFENSLRWYVTGVMETACNLWPALPEHSFQRRVSLKKISIFLHLI